MSLVEWVIALVFAALGARSVAHWTRHPVALETTRHRVLFAVFVTARAGTWFAIAGLFVLFATQGTVGRAFMDDVAPFMWLAFLPIALAVVAVASSALLAVGDDPPEDDAEEEPS